MVYERGEVILTDNICGYVPINRYKILAVSEALGIPMKPIWRISLSAVEHYFIRFIQVDLNS